tara:strand:+ start:299 stop:454 length:156 start_codon:yes stop_codon:yes gene_type:complete
MSTVPFYEYFSTYDLVKLELYFRVCPLYISRELPNGSIEIIKLDEFDKETN